MDSTTRANPYRHSFLKAGVPNFDPIFGTGFPYSWFQGDAFRAMKAKPGINHPWVYAAISTIISSYVQCPLRLVNKNDKQRELIDDHPILTLLKRPNPHISGTNFLELIVWCLDLPTAQTAGGQCFIWGDGANFRKGQIPDEIWLQGDAGVKAVLNEQKILQAWEFDYQQGISPFDYGRGFRLGLQEVMRINYLNPYNQLAGVSPGYPVRVALSQDADAQQLNSAMISNGGQARGVYTAKKPMSPQQMEEFKANLAKFTGGPENAGKDRLIPWEMEYNQLSLTPEDMQYMESLGWNRDTVMAAYKVSKYALQQYEDLNYATAKEAKRQLFDQAILPMHNMIMMELNSAWMDNVGRGDLQLTVDLSGVTALHDDMDARWKRADIAVQMGIPPIIALKMNEIATDDLKAFAWLMQNQSASAALSQAPTSADDNDGSTGKRKGLRIKAVLTPEQKRTMGADYITKVLDPGELPLIQAVRTFFNKQRNRNMDLADAWAAKNKKAVRKAEGDDDEAAVIYPPVSEFLLDAQKEGVQIAAMMYPHYQSISTRAQGNAQDTIDRLSPSPVEVDIQDAVARFLKTRLKDLSKVNKTTFNGVEDKLAEVIAQARADQLSVADTAKAIREGIQEVYDGRGRDSKTIARTETAVVTGFVQHGSLLAAGAEEKEWLSAHDEKVRPSHDDETGCPTQGFIPFNQLFQNGLQYPSDPQGQAKEVINCRCVLIPRWRE